MGLIEVEARGARQARSPADPGAVQQPSPVRLDPEKLAGLGLEEYPAMSAEEVLEGGTGQRGEVFFLGDELAVTEPLDYDEFVTALSGKLLLTDEQGTAEETYRANPS